MTAPTGRLPWSRRTAWRTLAGSPLGRTLVARYLGVWILAKGALVVGAVRGGYPALHFNLFDEMLGALLVAYVWHVVARRRREERVLALLGLDEWQVVLAVAVPVVLLSGVTGWLAR